MCRTASRFASDSSSQSLDENARLAFAAHIDVLQSAKPREILCLDRPLFFIFIDGAFEREESVAQGSVGGVLLSSDGVMLEYFSHQLSARVLQLLGDPEKKTVIYECELLACAGAL